MGPSLHEVVVILHLTTQSFPIRVKCGIDAYEDGKAMHGDRSLEALQLPYLEAPRGEEGTAVKMSTPLWADWKSIVALHGHFGPWSGHAS